MQHLWKKRDGFIGRWSTGTEKTQFTKQSEKVAGTGNSLQKNEGTNKVHKNAMKFMYIVCSVLRDVAIVRAVVCWWKLN